jgi:hypothetical protein
MKFHGKETPAKSSQFRVYMLKFWGSRPAGLGGDDRTNGSKPKTERAYILNSFRF